MGPRVEPAAAGESWSYQTFENYLYFVENGAAWMTTNKPLPCTYCDDAADGLPTAVCNADPGIAPADCDAIDGCDHRNGACLGQPLGYCSPQPSSVLCQTLDGDQTACEYASCVYDQGECLPNSHGAMGSRRSTNGWAPEECRGDVEVDPHTGQWTQDCTVDGDTHTLVWSPQTGCAYAMKGGTADEAKIRQKYDTSLLPRLPKTHYEVGDIRTSAGNLYVVVTAGESGGSTGVPNGTDPAKLEKEPSGLTWRFLAQGTTHGDLLGPPTSEVREVGTGGFVQYFVHGALVIEAGAAEAYRIGDRSEPSVHLKRRWQHDERSGLVEVNELFPTSDMTRLATGTALLPTGTPAEPSGYFASGDMAVHLAPGALAEYASYDPGTPDPDYDGGWLGFPAQRHGLRRRGAIVVAGLLRGRGHQRLLRELGHLRLQPPPGGLPGGDDQRPEPALHEQHRP